MKYDTNIDLFLWFWEDKTSRWPILMFLGVFIMTLIFMLIALIGEYKGIYATAGIACLIVAFYGASHFRTLMALKEVRNKLNQKKKKKKKTTKKITITRIMDNFAGLVV